MNSIETINSNNSQITNKGIWLALVTAIISGVSIFVNKFAVDSIKPVLLFTTVKNVAVTIIVLALIIAAKKFTKLSQLKRADIFKLLLIGIIGGGIPFYLYFTGLSQTSAINAALIHKTLILWVAMFSVPFLKERISKAQILFLFLIVLSNLLVGGFTGFSFSRGELMILAATILWSAENIISKITLKTIDPYIVMLFRMGIGALVLFAAGIATSSFSTVKVSSFSGTQILWLSLTIVFLAGYILSWYTALKHAPATTVCTILASSTIVTNVLSAMFVTHKWSVELFTQSILLAGLIFMFTVIAKKELTYSEPNTSLVQ